MSIRGKNCYLCGELLYNNMSQELYLDRKMRKVHNDCKISYQKAQKDFQLHCIGGW
jgi:hypothetical protein